MRKLLLAMLAASIPAAPAAAQRPVDFSVAAGPAAGGGQIDPRAGMGYQVSIGMGLHPALPVVSPWSIRVEGSYSSVPWQGHTRAQTPTALLTDPMRLEAFSATANVLWAPRVNDNPLHPYAITGAGLYRFDDGWGTTNHFGVSGGGGLWFGGARPGGYLELRYHLMHAREGAGLLALMVGVIL